MRRDLFAMHPPVRWLNAGRGCFALGRASMSPRDASVPAQVVRPKKDWLCVDGSQDSRDSPSVRSWGTGHRRFRHRDSRSMRPSFAVDEIGTAATLARSAASQSTAKRAMIVAKGAVGSKGEQEPLIRVGHSLDAVLDVTALTGSPCPATRFRMGPPA